MNLETPITNTLKTETAKPRLFFIDNIRWVMIVLVVLIHINVTYSGIGGWYYIEQNSNALDTVTKVICGLFGMFTQAYFMGFMFFLAGYFIPSAYDRKGAAKFMKDRLLRLGVPVFFYMFVINPFINYFLLRVYKDGLKESFTDFYSYYLSSGDFLGGTGPLWFALALIIFCAFYALVRLLMSEKTNKKSSSKFSITISQLTAALIVITSLITFMVRIIYPFGTGVYNMQLCFFTQYIVLFTAGIIAYRKNFLSNLSYRLGRTWLKFGVLFGMLFWVLIIILGGALDGNENAYFGGVHWQSAAYTLWESVICASVILGIIVIFRDRYNSQNRLSRLLSDNGFAVYVFHAPILIFISITLRGIYLPPLLKIAAAALITLPACFIFSYLVRKLPLVKKFFS